MNQRHTSTQDAPQREQQRGAVNDVQPIDDLMAYLRRFAEQRPEAFALTCLGIGFILGWRLKPW
jgi:hypothetical protein